MARLIDAEYLETFLKIAKVAGSEINADTMLSVVETTPTVEPMEWIPCSERLPEYENESAPPFNPTLVTVRNEKGGLHVTSSNYSVFTKRWICEVEPEGIKVIAWMPLPKPYEDGEEI